MYGSAQTKSFIVLCALAACLLGVSFALNLALEYADLSQPLPYRSLTVNRSEAVPGNYPPPQGAGAPAAATDDWKRGDIPQLKLAVLLPPNWKILSAKKLGAFTVVELDPGKQFYNVKIYAGPEPMGTGGLKLVDTKIDGSPAAKTADGLLYTVLHGGTYYTFDLGASLSLLPQFTAIVNSATFTN